MKQRIIDYCRAYYEFPADASDADVAEWCDGSLGEVFGNLSVAIEDFKAAFTAALPSWLKRMMNIDA